MWYATVSTDCCTCIFELLTTWLLLLLLLFVLAGSWCCWSADVLWMDHLLRHHRNETPQKTKNKTKKQFSQGFKMSWNPWVCMVCCYAEKTSTRNPDSKTQAWLDSPWFSMRFLYDSLLIAWMMGSEELWNSKWQEILLEHLMLWTAAERWWPKMNSALSLSHTHTCWMTLLQ